MRVAGEKSVVGVHRAPLLQRRVGRGAVKTRRASLRRHYPYRYQGSILTRRAIATGPLASMDKVTPFQRSRQAWIARRRAKGMRLREPADAAASKPRGPHRVP